jgi:hypothetical protein
VGFAEPLTNAVNMFLKEILLSRIKPDTKTLNLVKNCPIKGHVPKTEIFFGVTTPIYDHTSHCSLL